MISAPDYFSNLHSPWANFTTSVLVEACQMALRSPLPREVLCVSDSVDQELQANREKMPQLGHVESIYGIRIVVVPGAPDGWWKFVNQKEFEAAVGFSS